MIRRADNEHEVRQLPPDSITLAFVFGNDTVADF